MGRIQVVRVQSSEVRGIAAMRRIAGYSAFTLTELLVVITIIAILAALITAGAVNALNASKRSAITLEIGQLADGIERFKNEQGGAYPPNAMNNNTEVPPTPNYLGDSIYDQTINDFIRSFRKAFPRHNEPEGLLRRLAGATVLPPSDTSSATLLDGGMNGAEALYFWLGGFSSDVVYPISGQGGPSFGDGPDSGNQLGLNDEIVENRVRLYEFDLARLAPRNSDGIFHGVDNGGTGRFVLYNDPQNAGAQRRINLWTYAPKNSTSSFAYFDTSRHDPVNYDMDISGVFDLKIFALKKVREGFSGSGIPAPRDIHFVNKGKYQILHAGLDNAWGDLSFASITKATGNVDSGNASGVLRFPTGPFTGDIADTLTNFTPGTLESAQE
jgi:prepilin-type N-terminal cleavage/methylation domain-containing protein